MGFDIEQLSLEELIDLNKRLIMRIRYLQGVKAMEDLNRFKVGDRVHFHDHEGKPREGIVVRINQRTVSVHTDEKCGHWNVPPRFLTKSAEGGSQ